MLSWRSPANGGINHLVGGSSPFRGAKLWLEALPISEGLYISVLLQLKMDIINYQAKWDRDFSGQDGIRRDITVVYRAVCGIFRNGTGGLFFTF